MLVLPDPLGPMRQLIFGEKDISACRIFLKLRSASCLINIVIGRIVVKKRHAKVEFFGEKSYFCGTFRIGMIPKMDCLKTNLRK